MNIEYTIFESLPNHTLLMQMIELHQSIFNTTESLSEKIAKKPPILTILALDQEKVIGYKIGYEINDMKFYSWLGGVDNNYRNKGIASNLMIKQHQFLKEKGYRVVQTKTMNKWRSMLTLNIKHGFDVVETYIDERGLHKIILEKKL